MAFLGLGKKGRARTKERKAARREFKLAKMAVRTERAVNRQNTRITKTQTKQDGRTNRRKITQENKTARTTSRDRANEVAYENGMEPTMAGTAMGTILAGGKAASGLADLATSLSGAGMFGEMGAILNSGQGTNRQIEFDEDGDIDYVKQSPPNITQQPLSTPLILGVIAIVIMLFSNNKKR